jgi:hypothetical protein
MPSELAHYIPKTIEVSSVFNSKIIWRRKILYFSFILQKAIEDCNFRILLLCMFYKSGVVNVSVPFKPCFQLF